MAAQALPPRTAPGMAPGLSVGTALERVEDAALLMGRGRYIDDMPVAPGTGHAAILRSPHPHARVLGIDAAAALALPGVHAVVTGADARAWSAPFLVGVRQPMEHWCIATDRVRYAGEPVAIVVAGDRYRAEDALNLIDVRYEPLPAIVDPEAALGPDAPVLHEAVGVNLISERAFRYGEPEAAFARAAHRVATTVRYPRNACTPIECLGLIAAYDPGEGGYDVLSNFQGPMTLHPVMARALKVPGPRLRLRSAPDSGGSFGVKQALFPLIVAMALAARKAARPVKWIEDRLEHLLAATSATNRVTRIEAAVDGDGRVTALRLDQLEDCGAYLRAPEPATLYRNHGNLTGPYRIAHLAVNNRVVVTNKTPTGLNRGFGGPQLYYALERLMQRVAVTLGLDPLAVIERNLVPAEAMPYRAAAGAVFDSGDFPATVDHGVAAGALDELRTRQAAAQAEGRLYGIGFAAAVEPSISNMGYITTVLSAAERRTAGPKDGAIAHATVSVDPLGGVSVSADSLPQGQGHRTVLAQVVGDAPRPRARDNHGGAGARHAARPLVDRRRQLFQPLLRRRSPAPRTSRRCGYGSAWPGSRASGSTARPRHSASRAAESSQPAIPATISTSAGSRRLPTGRRAACRRACRPRCAKPPAGPRPRSRHRTMTTASTARPPTASSSISAASRSTGSAAPSPSTATSPPTMPAAASTRRWSTARSGAPSPMASARRSTRSSPIPTTATSSPAPSPTIWCRPPARCPIRSSCTATA